MRKLLELGYNGYVGQEFLTESDAERERRSRRPCGGVMREGGCRMLDLDGRADSILDREWLRSFAIDRGQRAVEF